MCLLRLRQKVKKYPLRIATKYHSRCLCLLGIYALPNSMLLAAYRHCTSGRRLAA